MYLFQFFLACYLFLLRLILNSYLSFLFFGFIPYIADRQNFDIERISGPFVDELILVLIYLN